MENIIFGTNIEYVENIEYVNMSNMLITIETFINNVLNNESYNTTFGET